MSISNTHMVYFVLQCQKAVTAQFNGNQLLHFGLLHGILVEHSPAVYILGPYSSTSSD